ncbi:MAG TPA: enoyl-CoA hydratase-related protein [Dehalococcoidia bacterium]|nr:enoyl-CoA hydratase-related protein [Dehalococcoidia bacterium]
MSDEAVQFEVQPNGVALITLNRPQQLNAMNEAMAREWREALDRCGEDASVRCVVITGAGRGFCAGQDLRAMASGLGSGEILRQWYFPIINRTRELPKPVIAAVNGVAVGAGLNLALCCDLRLASEAARFGQVFVGIGVIPDAGGLFYLPRLVGHGKAMELMLSGEIIAAREAERIGLVNRVFPADTFFADTLAFAEKLAAGPTAAYATIKRGLDLSATTPLAAMLDFEAEQQERASQSADAKEGIAAFIEKRSPQFTGR